MRAQTQGQVMPNVFNVWKPVKQLIWTRMIGIEENWCRTEMDSDRVS